MKIEIKNRYTNETIFAFECENNSVKITLLEAIRLKTNLRSANLRSANLSSANLSSADLSSADLSSANLSSADLSSANLDKRYIQVSCIGSSKRITTYCFDDDIVWCGCFTGTLEEFEFKVNKTHKNNEQYLKEYTGFINYVKSLK